MAKSHRHTPVRPTETSVGISRIAPARVSGNLGGVAQQPSASPTQRGDDHLWALALGLSVLTNAGLLVGFGFVALKAEALRQKSPTPLPPPPSVVMIFPEMLPTPPPATAPPSPATAPPTRAAAAPANGPQFARTSADQAAPRPDNPSLLGERDTRATSDRTPTTGAPPLPSQAGITPPDASQIETTHSDYQDGQLDAASSPADESSTPPATELATKPPAAAGTTPPTPPDTKSLDGTHPVEVPVHRELAKETPAPPTTDTQPGAGAALQPATQSPAFHGFQRKTAVVGSISRTGRSSLDVADSPLGRYQAVLSRAVEQEWQRNCVRHRDFITPGFLTVRFFVEATGKVRSVQFVGDMETGEVQKGFTLNAIRDAHIPVMPASLRREYDQEPLELIFRFYF